MKTPFPYEKTGREMTFSEARAWIDAYRKTCDNHPNPIFAESFSKEILAKILSDDECVGIRIYHGHQQGDHRLLLVGMDKQGNDLNRGQHGLKDDMPGEENGSGIYGDGSMCPNQCDNR